MQGESLERDRMCQDAGVQQTFNGSLATQENNYMHQAEPELQGLQRSAQATADLLPSQAIPFQQLEASQSMEVIVLNPQARDL